MLSFFLKSYPDETLYSIVSRYHIWQLNYKTNKTLKELFQSQKNIFSQAELPYQIENLVEQLPSSYRETVNNYILSNTLYSYYKLFLTYIEAKKLWEFMKNGKGKSIQQLAKIPKNINISHKLKFCPQCSYKNLNELGEMYWHRVHQLEGVWVCPLHEVGLKFMEIDTKSHLQLPDLVLSYENKALNKCSDFAMNQLMMFGGDVAQYLKLNAAAQFEFKGLAWLKKRYFEILTKKGFLKVFSTQSFDFYRQKFADAIIEHYGRDFWEVVYPEVLDNPGIFFENHLLACDLHQAVDRQLHLLLIRFLAGSLENFYSLEF